MSLKDKFKQEKPWANLGWTRKQWKAQKPWKSSGVSEEKFAQFILALDQDTLAEIRDHAHAEALVDKIFEDGEG